MTETETNGDDGSQDETGNEEGGDTATETQSPQSSNGASSNGGGGMGRVDQVLGVVVDVSFPDELPEIYSALKIEVEESDARPAMDLTLEVQQH
ncbi:MAG: hypothetical protein M3331_05750, partial [Actinomycetota bacterium]|nr:hypothetical protein [Actinomycetota bacterium]